MFDVLLTDKRIMRKLGGDIESGKVLAFDGNANGKETFVDADMGLSLVKVSDKFYDLTKVERIVATDTATGEKLDIQFSAFTENGESLAGGFAGETYVISTDGTGDNMGFLTPGTWVFLEKGIYISRIEFAETIVPIDQKYLPGVCLPVVELETVIEHDAVLSESDSAKLLEVFEIGTPVVIVFTMGDYRNTAVFTRFTSPDNAVKAFSTALFSGQVGLLSQESGEFTVLVQ